MNEELGGGVSRLRLGSFIEQQEGILLSQAIALTGNIVDAQDIVAETWINMMRFSDSFDAAKSTYGAWAYVIMKRKWIAELRRRACRRFQGHVSIQDPGEEAMLLLEVLAEHGLTPEQEFDRAYLKAAIGKAMEMLTPAQRAAIEAKLVHPTHKEVVEALGGHASTYKKTKTQLSPAYVRMKPILTAMEIYA